MPKIDAPTVAEHRAQKERDILAATVELLTSQGQDAVSPAAVAERAGLARTSVYQYHPSSASLVAAAVEELFRLAELDVAAALDAAGDDPMVRLEGYVRAMLQLAQSGHSPNRPISLHGAPAACRNRIRELHDSLLDPLTDIVSRLGCEPVGVNVALASGAIQGAVQLVERGADSAATVQATYRFLSDALAG